jgi:hypothetical protein
VPRRRSLAHRAPGTTQAAGGWRADGHMVGRLRDQALATRWMFRASPRGTQRRTTTRGVPRSEVVQRAATSEMGPALARTSPAVIRRILTHLGWSTGASKPLPGLERRRWRGRTRVGNPRRSARDRASTSQDCRDLSGPGRARARANQRAHILVIPRRIGADRRRASVAIPKVTELPNDVGGSGGRQWTGKCNPSCGRRAHRCPTLSLVGKSERC